MYGCVVLDRASKLSCLSAGSSVTGMNMAGGSRTSCSFLWLRSSSTAQQLETQDSQNSDACFTTQGLLYSKQTNNKPVIFPINFVLNAMENSVFTQITMNTGWTPSRGIVISRLTICHHLSNQLWQCTQFLETKRWRGRPALCLASSQSVNTTNISDIKTQHMMEVK